MAVFRRLAIGPGRQAEPIILYLGVVGWLARPVAVSPQSPSLICQYLPHAGWAGFGRLRGRAVRSDLVALKRGDGEQARNVFRFPAGYRRGDPERAQRMCGRSRHVVQMPDLRLQSPSVQDGQAMAAGASDPQAQRWLGWPDRDVQQARQWAGLLGAEPGQGRWLPRCGQPGDAPCRG
jgi:hypothetical protein